MVTSRLFTFSISGKKCFDVITTLREKSVSAIFKKKFGFFFHEVNLPFIIYDKAIRFVILNIKYEEAGHFIRTLLFYSTVEKFNLSV